MRRLWSFLCLVATLISPMAVNATPISTSNNSREVAPTRSAPAGPGKPAAIDCTTSPFGNTLVLGGEKEVFVGYRGGSAPNSGWLAYSRLDINAGGQLQHQDTWLGGNISSTLTNVSMVSGAATDLNADGKAEFVQTFSDGSGSSYRTVSHRNGASDAFWTPITGAPRHNMVAAAGDVTGDPDHDGEIALASWYDSTTGPYPLDVRVLNGYPDGSIASEPFNPYAFWRSGQVTRTNPSLISVATGDLNNDGQAEVIVGYKENGASAIQVIAFTHDVSYTINEGNNGIVAAYLREIASWRIDTIGTPDNIKVAAADIDGDYRDEIILAYDHDDSSNPGFSDHIVVRTFDLQVAPASTTIVQKGVWQYNEMSKQLALGAGDVDKDGLAEVVVGYQSYNPAGIKLQTLDAEQSTIFVHNTIKDGSGFRDLVNELALDVGDMNKDGAQDIVTAFRDSGAQLQVVRFTDQVTPTAGIQLVSSWRDGTQGRTNASNITVKLGDWDNDSLKAHYAPATGGSILCKQVQEPQISSAIFAPPFWQNIQSGQDKYGTVGKARSTSVTTETAVTTESSHSFSAYFGVGVDGEVASASAKVTAGYEFSSGKTKTGGTTTGTTVQEGWTDNGAGFLVFDNTAYNCYSYQLQISGVDQNGAAHFCENVGATQQATELDAWDAQNGTSAAQQYQWAPIARDWTNLTLFHLPGDVVQSSTVFGGTADRAVDGNTDGVFNDNSVSHTDLESSPWWQIDLESSQTISKLRLWNRTDCCSSRLADYFVFVSDTDFRSISNDPIVLAADSRVHTYTYTLSGPATTFLTLDNALNPIQGRYVRVQLKDTGTPRYLSLAEVQVFGSNHVEPDRYPVDVRDTDPTDGYLEVKIYNPNTLSYQWVKQRGKLLWNGAADGVLNGTTIGPGNVTREWSLQQDSSTHQATAESFGQSARVGVELEVEAGLIAKVQAGAGYEYSSGLTTESSRTVEWGTGFEMGGGVAGFPLQVNNQNAIWPTRCQYGFQPYYYWVTDESNYGYQHSYLVLDYIVPGDRNNAFDLDRSKNLTTCYQGTYKTGSNSAPVAQNDNAATLKNTSVSIDVLNNDTDPNGDAIYLDSASNSLHGSAQVKNNRVEYTPQNNYVGFDTISYTITDGFATSTGTVTIFVASSAVYLPTVRK
jgi:hypothetical protein